MSSQDFESKVLGYLAQFAENMNGMQQDITGMKQDVTD